MACLVVALAWQVGCTSVKPDVTGSTTPIDVLVVRDGAPVAGATVIFGDPSGAVAVTAVTDTKGAAASRVAVAMVTVIDPGQTTRLITVAHVQPGAPITIPLDLIPNPALPTVAVLTVQPPAGAPPAGTDHYDIITGCGSFEAQTLPATVAISADCIGASGNVPVVVQPWTANASLEHPGSPLAFSAGLAARAGAGFAFTASAWSTSCRAISVANPKPISLELWPRYDGLDFRNAGAGFCQPPVSPGFDFAYPVLALDEGLTEFVFAYVEGSLRMALKTRSFASTPSSIAAEADPALLVGDANLVSLDATGAAWTATPELDAADLIDAELTYSRGTQTFVRWRLIEPAGATAAPLPALPAAVGDYGLAAATERFGELHFLDATWVHDLASAQRALPQMLEPAERWTRLPAGAAVREYREQFYTN